MRGRKRTGPASRGSGPTDFEGLAPRQRAVALLIAQGKFNAEIADELEISIKTVDSHRAAVLGRLGLRNNVELTLHLIETGVVKVTIPEPPAIETSAESAA